MAGGKSIRCFLLGAMLLLPTKVGANECFDSATRMMQALKPVAEHIGQVALDRVSLSRGIYHAVVGQENDAYAEYSKGSIYLYVQFCQQPEVARYQILAHELGHAIDDAKGVLNHINWAISGRAVPWSERRSEVSANRWMERIMSAVRE